jgi:lysozyme
MGLITPPFDIEGLVTELARSDEEGLRLRPYVDSLGKCTTGIGCCLDTAPLDATERAYIGHDGRTLPITLTQARWLCAYRVQGVLRELDQALPWWRRLDAPRQRVLAIMTYNMGVPHLCCFKVALSAMQLGRWSEAAAAMLDSKWATQVGERAQRLARTMRSGV